MDALRTAVDRLKQVSAFLVPLPDFVPTIRPDFGKPIVLYRYTDPLRWMVTFVIDRTWI